LLTSAAQTTAAVWNSLVATVQYPLRVLYFDGPSWNGMGFWGGARGDDICSQLTNVPATFWLANLDQCYDLLNKKFNAFAIGVFLVAYIYVTLKTLSAVWYRYAVIKPLTREILHCLTESADWKVKGTRTPAPPGRSPQ
jgi:hypothetical protein